MAVGGDKVNYPDDVGTPTADLLLIKTYLNRAISTPQAKYITVDIHNFYLNTPMSASIMSESSNRYTIGNNQRIQLTG